MFSNGIIDFIIKKAKQVFFVYTVIVYILYLSFRKISWRWDNSDFFGAMLFISMILGLDTLAIFPSFYEKYPMRGLPVMFFIAIINYFLLYHKGKYQKIIDYFETNKPKTIHYLIFFACIILSFAIFPIMESVYGIKK